VVLFPVDLFELVAEYGDDALVLDVDIKEIGADVAEHAADLLVFLAHFQFDFMPEQAGQLEVQVVDEAAEAQRERMVAVRVMAMGMVMAASMMVVDRQDAVQERVMVGQMVMRVAVAGMTVVFATVRAAVVTVVVTVMSAVMVGMMVAGANRYECGEEAVRMVRSVVVVVVGVVVRRVFREAGLAGGRAAVLVAMAALILVQPIAVDRPSAIVIIRTVATVFDLVGQLVKMAGEMRHFATDVAEVGIVSVRVRHGCTPPSRNLL